MNNNKRIILIFSNTTPLEDLVADLNDYTESDDK